MAQCHSLETNAPKLGVDWGYEAHEQSSSNQNPEISGYQAHDGDTTVNQKLV